MQSRWRLRIDKSTISTGRSNLKMVVSRIYIPISFMPVLTAIVHLHCDIQGIDIQEKCMSSENRSRAPVAIKAILAGITEIDI